ncbi:MAG TPA: DUF192 domain-containing protein [Candidatus Paceibacterota bacterium]|nr:DUF192 domain-containing protein [Candidatus Paceibacterota bacterium]
MKTLATLLLVCAAAGGGLFLYYIAQNMHLTETLTAKNTKQIKVGTTTIAAEVVDNQAAREKGLSGRTSLPEGSGMLFVFEHNGDWGIWMKDMQFPIDILFISETGQVVSINANVSPDTYPEAFYPPLAVRYVLELPAGYAKKQNITTQSRFDLSSI